MARYIETEAKMWVPDLEALQARLDATADARQVRPRLHEYNVRYEDADDSLAARGIVLRLRRDHPLDGGEDQMHFTYKAPVAQINEGFHTRFEAETGVSNFQTMDLILKRMGYHEAMIYEKFRTTYALLATKVVLDEMPFGNFVEIEGEPEMIKLVISRLGLGQAPRFTESYVILFDRVKAALDLTFRDLTFENFVGIEVPENIFAVPVEA